MRERYRACSFSALAGQVWRSSTRARPVAPRRWRRAGLSASFLRAAAKAAGSPTGVMIPASSATRLGTQPQSVVRMGRPVDMASMAAKQKDS